MAKSGRAAGRGVVTTEDVVMSVLTPWGVAVPVTDIEFRKKPTAPAEKLAPVIRSTVPKAFSKTKLSVMPAGMLVGFWPLTNVEERELVVLNTSGLVPPGVTGPVIVISNAVSIFAVKSTVNVPVNVSTRPAE